MPSSRALRRLLATTLPAALLLAPAVPAPAQVMTGWGLNSYGLPGGVDTPSAEMLPDGTISVGVSHSDYGRRITGAAQVTPRITAALRYSKVDGIDTARDQLSDRSADLRLQLWGEAAGWRPAVAVGLQDFLGTGVYSGEYIVATKNVTDRLQVSAGLGWGRLAGKHRGFNFGTIGGTLNAEDWFRGGAEPFGAISWAATDNLRLVAEYSADDYSLEVETGKDEPGSHLNLGVNWRFGEAYQLSAYTIGGEVFGAQFSFALNPNKAPFPSGLEPAPAPVRPRVAPAADPEGWSGTWAADPTAQPAIQTALADALGKEGQVLEGMVLDANRAEVRIDNRRYIQQAEAIGRTARLMTRALPPSVETFVITSMREGLPVHSVVLRRSDVERLENTEAGQIAAAAQIVDAAPRPAGLVATPGIYPKFRWSLAPYFSLGNWDPDESFRYEVGGRLQASYELSPGLVLSGSVRQRLTGNADQKAPSACPTPGGGFGGCTVAEYLALTPEENLASNMGVPRVRSDGRMYSGNTSPVLQDLTLNWYAKPSAAIYTRVTAGYLERMYGGVSAEVLWAPADRSLAVGAEVNRVKKRDYDGGFDFLDYEATTGHVSLYYDFGNGFLGQIDAGRYLAGDDGVSLRVKRQFANGWEIGAYATKTDLSAEEFGEGSFDKGITIDIPVSWAIGQPTRQTVGASLGQLARDGGQRVRVSGRLYETVRDGTADGIYHGWGRFWR
ncbi:YjbH domain-containing protein [Paracoccus sp. S-4012]|uniref:YjbH domain-containing protein n=1 Tax=Paracoccus sp. S-4012 TaxID=2665648 RepID=UPI0012AF9CBF|nr:YjbH domain-containing protein [Paracoccus sp. S-4012]MRX50781.1 YjbH domain-containing protein [Paracoccus sp. S-4012]